MNSTGITQRPGLGILATGLVTKASIEDYC